MALNNQFNRQHYRDLKKAVRTREDLSQAIEMAGGVEGKIIESKSGHKLVEVKDKATGQVVDHAYYGGPIK